jgi:hypothetical protein
VGLWTKCDGCGEALFQSVLEENLWTCPHCDHHFRVPARTYVGVLADPGTFEERFTDLVAGDPLEFRDAKMRYPDRVKHAQKETGLKDAALSGVAAIGDKPVSLTVMDFFFMGGSMGSVVGEKVARSIETALAERRALVLVSSTGGARMQDSSLVASGGDITVLIPSNLAMTVMARNSTGSGPRIVSEFPEIRVTSTRFFQPLVAQGAINGGGPVLNLNASSGIIYLRRK